MDFRTFLLSVPKMWKRKKDLKDKNLKLLIDNKSKLLDKYETQAKSTLDEHIKRTKEIFEYFLDSNYIHKNPFIKLKSMSNGETDKREFREKESVNILKYLKKNNLIEEYNFFKFSLYTGLRRGETCKIKIKEIDLDKYIDLYQKGKTKYSKRIVLIHNDIMELVKEQMKNKNEEDYLFFNEFNTKLTEDKKEEEIGKLINLYIKKVVGVEDKKYIDIHSLRKNYAQIINSSDELSYLEVKTLIGHSTKNDTTDRHYIRGKRDYNKMKIKLNKISFDNFIDTIETIETTEDNMNLC